MATHTHSNILKLLPEAKHKPGLIDRCWRLLYCLVFRLVKLSWFLLRPHHLGVLVAIWSGDRILVVRQSYRPRLCLPGGGIGRRETPLQAALREVAEELGVMLAPDDITLAYVAQGVVEYRKSCVYVFDAVLPPGARIQIDRREVVWSGFVTARALVERRLDPHLASYLGVKRAVPVAPGVFTWDNIRPVSNPRPKKALLVFHFT